MYEFDLAEKMTPKAYVTSVIPDQPALSLSLIRAYTAHQLFTEIPIMIIAKRLGSNHAVWVCKTNDPPVSFVYFKLYVGPNPNKHYKGTSNL